MICGAIIGFTISQFIPPVFEAVFKLSTNVDFNKDPDITELMMDNSILHIGELAFQPVVLAQVIAEEKVRGINLTVDDFIGRSSVERRATTTLLKVRWNDPEIASQIANTWGIIFFKSLQDAYAQTIIAEDLSKYQSTLENCLLVTRESSTSKPYCGFEIDKLNDEIAENANRIAQAKNLSLGLYPELYVSAYQLSDIPGVPLFYNRGFLIIAGAFIGFLTALLLTELIFFRKFEIS
ncbi:MAG: hypothetical protein A2X25_03265 [Chloroflexi bacterium GWB2_49_20]|nr:MAG: hypothetical protein A2X25_03265 [Chloroflexi bacterium GWB2_49_20]OGN76117.1 MAG: hypothetical protein A2X26_11540 [Chloroflexi bacterium GWC2_49_37]OGN83503.1 MAG: hypothetical protein A2X27_09375 [Chloroflexi bacterium GWD2_49_16]HBG73904.1 hypothetical protein [Anaerolineae bacterium]HCC79517.1 hypothetical protein [Anaerolineae bacterium]